MRDWFSLGLVILLAIVVLSLQLKVMSLESTHHRDVIRLIENQTELAKNQTELAQAISILADASKSNSRSVEILMSTWPYSAAK